MIPILIAILGAILTIAGAIVQYNEKENAKASALSAKSEAKEFNTQLIASQTKLIEEQNRAKQEAFASSQEIIRLNMELTKKTTNLLTQSEIARNSQLETINFIQGSPAPELSFYGISPGVFAPVLFNSTNYPIYDVSVTIDDFDKIANCKSVERDGRIYINDECVSKSSTHQGPYFMSPGARQKITHKILGENTRVHLRIQCITRIKVTIYLCVLEPTKQGNKFCFRIYDLIDQKNHFVKEVNSGLIIEDEDYWNKHFYADKQIMTGPL